MCAILWLLLTNRGIFSDAVKIPCHKYEIKGLGNYFERGEREEGVFLKERLIWERGFVHPLSIKISQNK